MGQNPTSGMLSIQRRKDIYALCSKYDVMIIEDDPYWHLQFPSAAGLEAQARNTSAPAAQPVHKFAKKSGFPFLDSLVPSYLNFDYDGRVIRLDTFSKTVAPGCRLGWITAQPAIVERILYITETSTQQPSGFVQSMIAELIMGPQTSDAEMKTKPKSEIGAFSGWKTEGWIRWLEGLRGTYERRMNRMCSILEDGRFHLKQGTPLKASESDWAVISKTKMYSFDWPRAGMFVWVQMHFDSHPLWGAISGPKLATAIWIFLTRKPYLVLVSPGRLFSPTEEIAEEKGWQFFRLCFAAVDEVMVDMSSERFAKGVKAFWAIKDKKELEDIEDSVSANEAQGQLVDLGLNYAC
jgi:DNA-binding transcriptional MocR family regulator